MRKLGGLGVVLVVALPGRGGPAVRVYTIHIQPSRRECLHYISAAGLRQQPHHRRHHETPLASPFIVVTVLEYRVRPGNASYAGQNRREATPRHDGGVSVMVKGTIARKCNIMLICAVILSVLNAMYTHSKQKEHTSIAR